MSDQQGKRQAKSQRGMSIFLVAVGLTLLLATAGLSVDLANLYVARNEAQRAADAAALAGAQQFVTNGVATGLITVTQAAPLAAAQASQVGNQNLIIGRNPDLEASNFNSSCPPPSGVSGGCFDFSISNDPRITVVVQKNMPTYFMKALGISSIPISVQATAEAYTPSGGDGPTTSVQCLKPWLLPNCDPYHTVPESSPEGNSLCGTVMVGSTPEYYEYFVDPNNNDAVVLPGLRPTGVVGERIQIKPGSPSQATAPSQFWPVFLPATGTFVCPSCASKDQANGGADSGALYRENIECCSTTQVTCGAATVNPISGNMVGPTGQGVQCLIHEANNGTGQDYISLDSSLSVPFIMYAGSANPYGFSTGTQITTSDSLVTLPIYDGTPLCPGNSCPASVQVNVRGFLQLFIQEVDNQQSSVWAYVLNVSGCGGGTTQTGGGGNGGVVPVFTGAPIPVRLIHN